MSVVTSSAIIEQSWPLKRPYSESFRAGSSLNVRRIAIQTAAVIGLLFVNRAGPGGNAVFFAVLVLMIARSPELAFKALTLAFFGLISNQVIVPKTIVWTLARFIIPMICLIRFSLDLNRLRQTLFAQGYFLAFTGFIAAAAVVSIISQYFVGVALLKLLNFSLAVTAMFSGVQVLRTRKSDLTEWYVLLCAVSVVLSFVSLAAGFGYNMRGSDIVVSTFNGCMYHSNCLGPLSAMMAVYLACVVLFGRHRNRWLCAMLGACLVYFMALTQSRTSFVALFVGILAAIGLTIVLARRRYIRLRMNVSRLVLIAGIAAAGVGGVLLDMTTGNVFTRAVVAFANKGGSDEGFDIDQALSSRRQLIEHSWQNFLESPLTGIGFEVAKTEFFRKNATLFYAPIEKGFLPVAILEETGIIGAMLFALFLLVYARMLARSLNIPGIALLTTFLAVNCGEAMLFAVGGHGGFGWILCMGGVMLGDYCVERLHEVPTGLTWKS